MKKSIVFILTILIFLSIATGQVSAHVLRIDKNIGAVLHIDPNDNPIAGQQAGFFFEFTDRQNKFKPSNCDCTFLITENGETIFSQPLFANNNKPSLSNASIFFTFPKRDVYQIQVIGKPISQGDFQPFTLTWDWRVDEQASASRSNNFLSEHLPHFIIIGAFLIFFLIYFVNRIFSGQKQSARR